jgi:hypothetical protein
VARLEELTRVALVRVTLPNTLAAIVDVERYGGDSIRFTYRKEDGTPGHEVLDCSREPMLEVALAGRGASMVTAASAP